MFLLLAAALLWIEYAVTYPNYGAMWNGIGAIPQVIQRKGKAPMVYRVLVPWLTYATNRVLFRGKLSRKGGLIAYLFWKWVFMSASLSLAAHLFGIPYALVIALAWVICFQYDYWTPYVETLVILLALTGNPYLFLLGLILGALSKESTILAVPTFLLLTSDPWWTLAGTILWFAVRYAMVRYQGKHKRYVSFMAIKYNLDFISEIKKRNWTCWPYFAIGVVMILAASLAPWYVLPPALEATVVMVPIIALGGLFISLLWEPRTMVIMAIWIGGMVCI